MAGKPLGPIKGLDQAQQEASTLVLAEDLEATGSLGAHDIG